MLTTGALATDHGFPGRRRGRKPTDHGNILCSYYVGVNGLTLFSKFGISSDQCEQESRDKGLPPFGLQTLLPRPFRTC